MTRLARALIAIAIAILAATGCSASDGIGNAPPSSAPSCTTSSCAVSEIQHSLVGLQAKDGAAITKASCKVSTVKHNSGNTWTADCTVTESDGGVFEGTGNWFPDKGTVTFEPVAVITAPST